jgi:hypothetical protein
MTAHELAILVEVLKIPDPFWTSEEHQFSAVETQVLLHAQVHSAEPIMVWLC